MATVPKKVEKAEGSAAVATDGMVRVKNVSNKFYRSYNGEIIAPGSSGTVTAWEASTYCASLIPVN